MFYLSNRREFLFKDLPQMLKETYGDIVSVLDIVKEVEEEKQKEYFSSYETCYPILSEASIEEIRKDAISLGIDPKNKSKYELAKQIYNKK